MSQPEDNDLREMFARSRAEDRERARDFDSLLATASSRHARRTVRTRRTVTLLAAASVVFAVAYVALQNRTDGRKPGEAVVLMTVDPAATRWRSPTDFLLDTPGNGLLRSLPTLRYTNPEIFEDSTLTPLPAFTSPASRSRRIRS